MTRLGICEFVNQAGKVTSLPDMCDPFSRETLDRGTKRRKGLLSFGIGPDSSGR
jgi:hypothetical protein